jgi:3-isopropylmalate/(R)-2-methylmalate dehydratase small subunit
LLPVVVDADAHDKLLAVALQGGTLTVDLENNIVGTDRTGFAFAMAPAPRRRLLAGLDSIGESLLSGSAIDTMERRLGEAMPWLPTVPA